MLHGEAVLIAGDLRLERLHEAAGRLWISSLHSQNLRLLSILRLTFLQKHSILKQEKRTIHRRITMGKEMIAGFGEVLLRLAPEG